MMILLTFRYSYVKLVEESAAFFTFFFSRKHSQIEICIFGEGISSSVVVIMVRVRGGSGDLYELKSEM